jgi:hypothetical protein
VVNRLPLCTTGLLIQRQVCTRERVGRNGADNPGECPRPLTMEEVQEEAIQVLGRIRPLTLNEASTSIIDVVDERTLKIKGRKSLQCRFDAVLGSDAGQEDLYAKIYPLTKAVSEGFNATIFAYGQTGSGKTYSMSGTDAKPGIIPRAIVDVFRHLGSSPSTGDSSANVSCSFLQIYNEQVFDMLRDPKRGNPLEVHEDPREGIYVQGLSEHSVGGLENCLRLLRKGEENRAIRETNMNQASSRSHSIFQLTVERRTAEGPSVRSKFNMVDLAGSEKWDVHRLMDVNRVSEMTNINLSLYTLGRCVAALSAHKGRSGDGGLAHVPYRDAKLTFLLQDSLGGNSKTRFIVNLSPSSDSAEESLSTLKFADRARDVIVFVRKNEHEQADVNHRRVGKLQREIRRLRRLLVEKNDPAASAVEPQLPAGGTVGATGTAAAAPQGDVEKQFVGLVATLSEVMSSEQSLRAMHKQARRDNLELQTALDQERSENQRLREKIDMYEYLVGVQKENAPGSIPAPASLSLELAAGTVPTKSRFAEDHNAPAPPGPSSMLSADDLSSLLRGRGRGGKPRLRY